MFLIELSINVLLILHGMVKHVSVKREQTTQVQAVSYVHPTKFGMVLHVVAPLPSLIGVLLIKSVKYVHMEPPGQMGHIGLRLKSVLFLVQPAHQGPVGMDQVVPVIVVHHGILLPVLV